MPRKQIWWWVVCKYSANRQKYGNIGYHKFDVVAVQMVLDVLYDRTDKNMRFQLLLESGSNIPADNKNFQTNS